MAIPFPISFSWTNTRGPDGPWHVIRQAVDYPDQYVPMHPSLSATSLIIEERACSQHNLSCPRPLPGFWSNNSGAYDASNGILSASPEYDASSWDSSISEPLRLQGQGQYTANRMTLHLGNDGLDPQFLDTNTFGVSNNFAATFPGGVVYTLDVGYFSLNAVQQTFSWTNWSGATIEKNRTLPLAYQIAELRSVSYGLHVGSAEPNVSASLILGGYDSYRCLTQPIVSSDQLVQLVDIGLGVANGGGAYQGGNGSCATVNGGLLKGNGFELTQINVMPNPGVPYLYLPQSTCDAIASYLPVRYDAALGLYIWETSVEAYQYITSSPHFLRLTFASGSSTADIDVPFVLLNLTLTVPIVTTNTQYFPCSPYNPSDGSTYHLGRAFLQAAFLAQNWQTGKLWLAQAPGPGFLFSNLKALQPTDSTLTAAANSSTWQETWSDVLVPLAVDNSTTLNVCYAGKGNASGGGGKGGGDTPSKGLSGGTIAGIVIAVIAGLAIIALAAFFLMRRRRRTQTQGMPLDSTTPTPTPTTNLKYEQYPMDSYSKTHQELPEPYITAEMPANETLAEMDTQS